MILPNFPAALLTTTICPLWRSIICGRTALVKEMEPTKFKSKSALSTSNDVFSTKDSCDLPALFTKMSTYHIKKTNVLIPAWHVMEMVNLHVPVCLGISLQNGCNFLGMQILLAIQVSERPFAFAWHFWHSSGWAGECLCPTQCIEIMTT